MKKDLSLRDHQELSAYLDGELKPAAANRMEDRLARDPNLRAALEDLRATKSILQRTPARKAPRNYNLTPQMVAKAPPVPRLVPALNYASVLALFLFFFSFLPSFSMSGAAPAAEMAEAPAAVAMVEEAPAAEMEMPAAAAEAVEEKIAVETQASPLREGEPAMGASPTIEAAPQLDESYIIPTDAVLPTMAKEDTPSEEALPLTFSALLSFWQRVFLLAGVSLLLIAYFLRRAAALKWEGRS